MHGIICVRASRETEGRKGEKAVVFRFICCCYRSIESELQRFRIPTTQHKYISATIAVAVAAGRGRATDRNVLLVHTI